MHTSKSHVYEAKVHLHIYLPTAHPSLPAVGTLRGEKRSSSCPVDSHRTLELLRPPADFRCLANLSGSSWTARLVWAKRVLDICYVWLVAVAVVTARSISISRVSLCKLLLVAIIDVRNCDSGGGACGGCHRTHPGFFIGCWVGIYGRALESAACSRHIGHLHLPAELVPDFSVSALLLSWNRDLTMLPLTGVPFSYLPVLEIQTRTWSAQVQLGGS